MLSTPCSMAKRRFADFRIETLLKKENDCDYNNRGNLKLSNYSNTTTSKIILDGHIQSHIKDVYDDDHPHPPKYFASEEQSRRDFAGLCSDKEETDGGTPTKDNTFAWLNCTRFKPPKLPRARRKIPARKQGRGPRIPFSSHQLAVLERTFLSSQYLSSDSILKLAQSLHLTETRVKIWFQNRRARFRREKESSLPLLTSSSTTATVGLPSSLHYEFPPTSADMSSEEKVNYYFISSGGTPSTKESFRHLINDLNLLAAANVSTSSQPVSPSVPIT